MADLFTLMGKIAIDCTEAENKIDALIAKADTLNGKLGGTKTTGTGGASSAGTTSTGSANSSQPTQNGTVAQDVAAGTAAGNTISRILEWVGGSVVDKAKEGYNYEVEKEKQIVNLQALTNSTREEATALFEELNKLSIDTPLNMDSIGYAATRLTEQGFATDELAEAITVLGNVAKGENSAMQRLTAAAMQIFSKGTLKAEEVEQLADNGIPIYPLLADFYGLSGDIGENNSYLRSLQEKGGISKDDFWGALVLSQSAPGKTYYNQMALAMETTKGINEQGQELATMYSGKILQQSGFMAVQKGMRQLLNDIIENEIERLEETPLFSQYNPYWDENTYYLQNQVAQKGWLETFFPFLNKKAEPEVFGPPTPEGWTPASNVQNTEAVVAAIQSAVESIPGAVAAGFADATINVNVTTSDVRLDTGALVGQIMPHVNIGLGAIGALYGRGLS